MEINSKKEDNNKPENNAFFHSNINNKKDENNKKNLNKKNSEEGKDSQFYLITLEDNNGEHQQIRIFKNSDPSEIAFNFCKENNLDFKSMKYIKKNIQKIIEQFDEPNHKLFFLDNSYSSIQEVDEENMASENTVKSKNSICVNENNNNNINTNNKDKAINTNYNNINCVMVEKNNSEKNNDKNVEIVNDSKNNNNCNKDIKNKDRDNKQENENATKNKKENENTKEISSNQKNIIENQSEITDKKTDINIIGSGKEKGYDKVLTEEKLDHIVIASDKKNCKENEDKKNNNNEIINNNNNIKNNICDVNSNKEYNKEISTPYENPKSINKPIDLNQNNKNILEDDDNNHDSLILNIYSKNSFDKNNSIELKNASSSQEESQKEKKKLKDILKEKEIIDSTMRNNDIQNHKKFLTRIIDKKIEKRNTNPLIINKQVKKDTISSTLNKNILKKNSINLNNQIQNKNIKLQNKMPKLFKYINPKQHLINEEYKILKKKELNRENILDKYFKFINRKQKLKNKGKDTDISKSKSKSKEKYKTIEKEKDGEREREKDKSKTNKTFANISNSNLNIKKVKEKEKEKERERDSYNPKNIIETDIGLSINIKRKNKNKNRTTLESITSLRKENKSLLNVYNNSNLNYTENERKKSNKDKENLDKNTYTPLNLFMKIKKKSSSNITINQRKNSYSKFRKKLKTRKEIFENIMSNTFINNSSKINNNATQNTYTQTQDKCLMQNKSTKNKVIIKHKKKNNDNKENSRLSNNDLNRQNEMNQNTFIEKTIRTFEGESGSKSKRISEMRNGLNKIFNNFLGQKNNILNTNYIINKRCRIINNKNKKNMSMNLSRYILDFSKKKYKSPKYHLEINVSNNNFDNLTIKDSQTNTNQKVVYGKNNNLLTNNAYYRDSIKNYPINTTNKKNHYILFNTHNQSLLRRYNTNINNSSHILTSMSSRSKTKKKIIGKRKESQNISKHNSSLIKRKNNTSKNKNIINNLNISNSLLLNTDKTNQINDYCLKVLDQYYTINNTINITNNNSLLNSFSNNNNNTSNKKRYKNKTSEKISDVNCLMNNLFKCLDKDNNGFIIISYKQKLSENLCKNYNISKEVKKILSKMLKILFEIQKKNSRVELEDDKTIIKCHFFVKYMEYIYNNKLNINEKKVLLSFKKEFDRKVKKDVISYNFKPKSSFNRFKDNKYFISSFNSSSRLNNTKENKSITNDINKFFKKKIRKNSSKDKRKFNSFNDI